MAEDDVFTLTSLPASEVTRYVPDNERDVDVFAVLRDTADRTVDVYKTQARHAQLDETELYDDYREEYFQNPLVRLLVEHVVGELMQFHFEGDPEQVKIVKLAWDNLDIDSQLTIIARQGILLGNGFGDKQKKGKTELVAFKDIDAAIVEISRDEETGEETFKFRGDELARDKLFVMRLLEYPDTPLGMSMLRASIKALQAMGQLSDDVPAAVKRLAYAEKILKLDMDDISDPAKKKEYLKKAKEKFEKYDSATSQVTAMDKKHSLEYVGAVGGGTQRIMPLMGILEPLLMFVLTNFYMAAGHIMQTGANKSLLEMQEKRARQALLPLKKKFARLVERELIADILGIEIDFKGKKPLTEPLPVRLVHDKHPDEGMREREVLLKEYLADLVPREYIQAKFHPDLAEMLEHIGAGEGTYFSSTELAKLQNATAEGSPTSGDKNGGAKKTGSSSGRPTNFSEVDPTSPFLNREDDE